MKTINVMAVAALMFACSSTSFAQFVGTGGGSRASAGSADQFTTFWVTYAPTNFKGGISGYSIGESGYNTFAMGLTHASPLSGSSLMVDYGAFAEWIHKSETDDGVKMSEDLIGVKVPISLMYGLDLADNVVIYPYAGLNARFFIVGKVTEKYQNESESQNIFEDGNGLKRFSLGYQVGLRAKLSGFIIGVGYEDMITSMSSQSNVNLKINMITISAGIPF